MKDEFNINEPYFPQLDAWEKWLTTILDVQSDSTRTVLRYIHRNQGLDNCKNQLLEYSDKQLTNWIAVEKDFLTVIFQSVRNFDTPFGYTPEMGKETANQFIDHWGHRTGKALEAHTEFYSLIFPWDDGEPEAKEEIKSSVKSDSKHPLNHRKTASAA